MKKTTGRTKERESAKHRWCREASWLEKAEWGPGRSPLCLEGDEEEREDGWHPTGR